MKLATFNANSIRVRLGAVLDWLATHRPDVLAIQETKCPDEMFPAEPFKELGYNVAFSGQKSYNGVAFASLGPMRHVSTGFGDPAWPADCRILRAEIDGITFLNTYVPNGTRVGSEKWSYKLAWLERFRQSCLETVDPKGQAIWLGDINIAPTPDDVFDSPRVLGGVGHHPDEFARLDAIVEHGWHDLFRAFTQGPGHYTYWEFTIPNSVKRNLGWRIDHIYATAPLASRAVSCLIDIRPRLAERPSDHTFVLAELR